LHKLETPFVILLVDDDTFILEVLRIQLERALPEHITVERALSPGEAIEMLEDWKKDNFQELALIVSDYLMPEMLGSDFLLKANELFPKARKMMLTGQAEMENVLRVLHEMSLFRYLSKPWEPAMMNKAVLAAVEDFIHYYQMEKKLEECVSKSI
jgi:CheY-like chemotaxis protein